MSDEDEFPKEPLNPLVQEAVAMHEVFLALIEGKFTPQQALYVVAQMAIGRL